MASLDNISYAERNRSRNPLPNIEYYHYTLKFFTKVCKKMCNLNTKQINTLQNILKKTESGHNTKVGEPYIFTNEELYSTLLKNPSCRAICENQNYTTWDDIIRQFS